jgi:hypothetical protein
MKNEHEIKESEKVTPAPEETSIENSNGDGEFKLTVRKLELPVRPRGVLAE